MEYKYITNSTFQTKKIGEELGKKILKQKPLKEAIILTLKGDLGGGKTTFLQGFAKGLGIKEKILSPTFIIIRKFPIPNSQFVNFYHIDCYRLQKSKEILELDFKKIISNPQNIIAIEWADKIQEILPKNVITLKFYFINKNKRKIVIKFNKKQWRNLI